MTSEKATRSRLPGNILVAALSLPIGAAGTWWVDTHTAMTPGVWAVALVAALLFVLLLLGPKAVKR